MGVDRPVFVQDGPEPPASAPYHAGVALYEGAASEAVDIIGDFDRRKDELDPAVRDAVEFAATAALDPRAIEDADVERSVVTATTMQPSSSWS